jgi:hypothetical protein
MFPTPWSRIGGVEYIHAFLTSALDGGECSASRPARFTPRERAPRYPLFVLKHHDKKTYGGVEIKLHAFLNSVLGGG